MSLLWFGPAIGLMVGAFVIAKQAMAVRVLAAETEVALAEAGEVLSIVSFERGDFGELLGRLGVAAGSVGGPWRATSTSARLMRSWWQRGQTQLSTTKDVPLKP